MHGCIVKRKNLCVPAQVISKLSHSLNRTTTLGLMKEGFSKPCTFFKQNINQ